MSSGRAGDGGVPPVESGRAPHRDNAVVRKVVACLLRNGSDGPELLVFDHPQGTVQIPKGTLEAGELPHVAVLRELEEESGVSDASIDLKIGDFECVVRRGPDGAGPFEEQVWHVFRLSTRSEHPDSWRHEAVGSPEEDGLTLSYRWLVLSRASDLVDPLYRPVVEALLGSA